MGVPNAGEFKICGQGVVFVLNTHLLLSPMMKSINLEHWHFALEKMLLLFTEVSDSLCKESFLFISNSDFQHTTEKNQQTFAFVKEIA